MEDFNLHNILRFRLKGTSNTYLRYLCSYFSYFKVKEITEPDFEIQVSKFDPDLRHCYIINRKYYIKNNYIFWEDSYKGIKWKVCIENIEGKTRLQFSASRISKVLLRDILVESLLRYKLVQRSHILVHASGMVLNNTCFIFPAYMGTGKTTTILNLIGKGEFLGNDKVIISDKGLVYSFPLLTNLYYYNVKQAPKVLDFLNHREKLELKMKYLLYLFSKKYVTFPLEIPSSRLWKIMDKTPLDYIIFLTKTTNKRVKINEFLDRKVAAKRLTLINIFDMKYLLEPLYAYTYVFQTPNIDDFEHNFYELSANILKSIPIYEIEIPVMYDRQVFEEIYDFLVKLTKT